MRASISTRLILPFALFLAPIAFLLFFLIQSHQKDILITQNEIAGIPAVSAALSTSRALLLSVNMQEGGRATLRDSLSAFAKASSPWQSNAMINQKSVQIMLEIERLLAAPSITIADVREPLEALSGFIRLIGDASQLVLDSDLASFYAMDMLVILAPDIIAAKQKMLQDHAASDLLSANGSFFRNQAFRNAQIFSALSGRLIFNMQNIRRHGKASQDIERTQYIIDQYGVGLENIHGRDSASYAFSDAFSAVSGSLYAQEEWQKSVEFTLLGMLRQRVASFESQRNQQIILSLLMFCIASTALIWLTRHYVTNPLQGLTNSMMRLANGQIDMALPEAPMETEIAEMVRAVSVFRENAIRNQVLELEKQEATAALNFTASTLQRAEMIAELGNWRLDMQAGRINWSPNLFVITGFDSAIGLPNLRQIFRHVPRAEKLRLVHYLRTVFHQYRIDDFSCGFNHPEYGLRYFQSQIAIERAPDGSLFALMGIVQDISEIRENELKLQARTQSLAEAQLIGRIGDWSYAFGQSNLVWSPEIYRLLGYDEKEFVTSRSNVMALYHGDGSRRLLEAQAEVIRTGEMRSIDIGVRCGDGRIADFTVTSKAEYNPQGEVKGFAGTIQDISARKKAERELEKLAFYDPLTGLANRALFQRALQRELERCLHSKSSSALLLLDLDKFKEVNDSLGHAAGDELLVRTSERLSRALPQSAFMARLGGDEFAIILTNIDNQATSSTADMIVRLLAEPVQLRLGEVQIGTSIGIAMLPTDGQQQEDLVRHADLALYNAKDEGRSCARFFTPQLSNVVQEKTAIARDLKKALGREDQLYVVFQPQVDIQNGKVTGFEALLRWRHPERGNVPPVVFIPIAESSSLISDLGLYVLWASCRQMKDWLDAGYPERDVAVNVSPTQIWQSDFEQDVKQVLMDTGLPPHLLTLEVTESVFLREGEGRVRQALDGLKALGIKLALDDFGTGYSSLGYLNRLPFDKLKIDRRFIAGVHRNPSRFNLLRGIIELGLGLGMTTVAEGAEQIEEVRALRSLNCHVIQGYVFSHPLEGDSAVRAAAMLDLMVPGKAVDDAPVRHQAA